MNTIHFYRSAPLVLAVTTVFIVTVLPAHGALNEDLGISPKAMSLGNAVTADPPGIYSVHFNPAGLAELKGTHAQMSVASPWFKHQVEFSSPEGFGVFGFSDDPVQNRTSRTERAAILMPLTDNMVSAPQGMAAPSAGGLSYSPPDSKMTFATAFYPPLVGGLNRDRDSDPARFGGRLAAAERITYFTPSIGYDYSEDLSLGVSLGLSYVGISAQSEMRAPNPIIGLTRTVSEEICPALGGFGAIGLWFFGAGCSAPGIGPFESAGSINLNVDDAVVPHYNLGVQWEPTEWLGFGATYRSEATAELAGEYTIDYSEDFEETITTLNQGPIFRAIFAALQLPPRGSDKQSGRVNLNVTFPQHIKLGTKIKPTSNLQLNVDWGWTDWDEWDEFKVNFDQPNDLLRLGRLLTGQGLTQLSLPRGYKSNSYWGAGLMYDLTPHHQLRFGFEDRKSSIPEDRIGMFGPLPDAQLYGTGLGYTWSRHLNFDFSLVHLRAATTVPANSSTNLNSTGVGNLIYNPYAGLDVSFETQATIGSVTANYRF
jgi:long-subunit fatty acid transport protein